MADFFTRLAERSLGNAPVTQPLIAPRFAPGPALVGETPAGLEQEETVESAGDVTQAFLERETLVDASPPASPHFRLVSSERALPSVMPNRAQHETADTRPTLGHHVESSINESGKTSPSLTPTALRAVRESEPPLAPRVESDVEQEAHGTASPVLQNVRAASQRPTPDIRSVPRRSAESGPKGPIDDSPFRREVGSEVPGTFAPISRLVRFEDLPVGDRSTGDSLAALEPLIREKHGSRPPTEPTPETPKDVSESQRGLKALYPEHRQVLERRPSAASPQKPFAPRFIRPSVVAHRETARLMSGEHEATLKEPLSSTPTIRVTIGRVEVRAIQPPMSPQPRTTPARRGPALSLNDYLKQRNEVQR
jgi:hypothetical protein